MVPVAELELESHLYSSMFSSVPKKFCLLRKHFRHWKVGHLGRKVAIWKTSFPAITFSSLFCLSTVNAQHSLSCWSCRALTYGRHLLLKESWKRRKYSWNKSEAVQANGHEGASITGNSLWPAKVQLTWHFSVGNFWNPTSKSQGGVGVVLSMCTGWLESTSLIFNATF